MYAAPYLSHHRWPTDGILDMCIYVFVQISEFAYDAGDDVPALALMKENDNPTDTFGPVVRAILTEQFHRLFFGSDGLWWEDDLSKVDGFKDEIDATTLGTVLDDNLTPNFSGDVFRL